MSVEAIRRKTLGISKESVVIDAVSGVIDAEGGVETDGFDYAEYFANLNPVVIPDGTIVTIKDGKVRPASTDNDLILGTLTATAGIIGDGDDLSWSGMYERDEFLRTLGNRQRIISIQYKHPITGRQMSYVGPMDEFPYPLPPGTRATESIIPHRSKSYVDKKFESRKNRPKEWSLIALMGQVYVRVYTDIPDHTYVSPLGRRSYKPTQLFNMTTILPFDAKKGYGVVKCLLRGLL